MDTLNETSLDKLTSVNPRMARVLVLQVNLTMHEDQVFFEALRGDGRAVARALEGVWRIERQMIMLADQVQH